MQGGDGGGGGMNNGSREEGGEDGKILPSSGDNAQAIVKD